MTKPTTWTVNVHAPFGVVPLLSWRCDNDTALSAFLAIADTLNTKADARISLNDWEGREVIGYDNRTNKPKGNPCHN